MSAYKESMADLVAHRVAEINLTFARRAPDSEVAQERIYYTDRDGDRGSLTVPIGLDDEGALIVIDSVNAAFEAGRREGRQDMARDVRELIGAERAE